MATRAPHLLGLTCASWGEPPKTACPPCCLLPARLMSALGASVWLHISMPGTHTCRPDCTKLRLCTSDSAQATCSRLWLPASSCGQTARVSMPCRCAQAAQHRAAAAPCASKVQAVRQNIHTSGRPPSPAPAMSCNYAPSRLLQPHPLPTSQAASNTLRRCCASATVSSSWSSASSASFQYSQGRST